MNSTREMNSKLKQKIDNINIESLINEDITIKDYVISHKKIELQKIYLLIIKEFELIGKCQANYMMTIANGIKRSTKIIKNSRIKFAIIHKLIKQFKDDRKWLSKYKIEGLIDIRELEKDIKEVEWYMNQYKTDQLQNNITG